MLKFLGITSQTINFLYAVGVFGAITAYLKSKYGRFIKYTQQGNAIIYDRENKQEYIESRNGTIVKL